MQSSSGPSKGSVDTSSSLPATRETVSGRARRGYSSSGQGKQFGGGTHHFVFGKEEQPVAGKRAARRCSRRAGRAR
eukprot:5647394-Prymnesium_polylepis.1